MGCRIRGIFSCSRGSLVRYGFFLNFSPPCNSVPFLEFNSIHYPDTGMKRSAIRRVELPSMLVFKARADKQLPMPSEKNEDGNRYYKRLFKTDATLLVEVLVTKIVDPIPK